MFDIGNAIVIPIDLDIYNNRDIVTVYAKQYEKNSRCLIVSLFEDGSVFTIPDGTTATFGCTKPNSHVVVDSVTIEDNKIYFLLTEQCTVKDGTFDAEFTLYFDDAVLCSPRFQLQVDKAAVASDSVASADEVNVLNALIIDANEALNAMGDITSTEAIRVSNENTRISNEEIRQTDETDRVNSETTRKANEITRQSNETIRQTNEVDRVNSEVTRKSDEITRQSQEVTRQTNTATAITNAETATNNANNASDNANTVANALNTQTLKIYKDAVTTYADLATTYPAPENGWTVVVTGEEASYRYNGSSWINIGYVVGDVSADNVTYDNTTSRIDSTTVQGAIDELKSEVGDLDNLQTEMQTSLVSSVNEIKTNLGNISSLQTTSKSNLVESINEVNSPTFTEASTLTNVNSGENKGTLWGKVKKFFTFIGTTVLTTTATTISSAINELVTSIAAKINNANIANNTTTTESGLVLDARQGKVLQDNIAELNDNLATISNSLTDFTMPSQQFADQAALDGYLNNVTSIPARYYRRYIYIGFASTGLGGGSFYIEGVNSSGEYGWQRAVTYRSAGAAIFYRTQNAGTWTTWVAK